MSQFKSISRNFSIPLTIAALGFWLTTGETQAASDAEFSVFRCEVTEVQPNKHFANLTKTSVVEVIKNRDTGWLRANVGDQAYDETKRDRINARGPFGTNETVTILPAGSTIEIEINKLATGTREILVDGDLIATCD